MAANRPKRNVKEIRRFDFADFPVAVKKEKPTATDETEEEEEVSPGGGPVTFKVNSVASSFDLKQELDILHVAETLNNTEYRNEGIVGVKIKDPEETTINVRKSGRIYIMGSSSEDVARVAGRKIARLIQTQCGYPDVKFAKFKINNVNVSATLPFGVKTADFAQAYTAAEFEPELFPAAIYRMKDPKATLHIFHNGKVTVMGVRSTADAEEAVNRLYPMVHEYRKLAKRKKSKKSKSGRH